MSRSYKKTPICKSKHCKRTDKRLASKAVRNCKEVQDGKWYRRLYQSWDINDWIFYFTWGMEMNSQRNTNPYWCVGLWVHYRGSIVDGAVYPRTPDRNKWERDYRRK